MVRQLGAQYFPTDLEISLKNILLILIVILLIFMFLAVKNGVFLTKTKNATKINAFKDH